jgi:hypothetical protein
MNNPPTKYTPTLTWVTAVLVVLLFYVGTWPIAEIKLSQWLRNDTVLPDGTYIIDLNSDPEPFLHVFYRPLRLMRGEPEFIFNPPGAAAFYHDNVISRYWLWWMEVLE